jgi:hypothetical protein
VTQDLEHHTFEDERRAEKVVTVLDNAGDGLISTGVREACPTIR